MRLPICIGATMTALTCFPSIGENVFGYDSRRCNSRNFASLKSVSRKPICFLARNIVPAHLAAEI